MKKKLMSIVLILSLMLNFLPISNIEVLAATQGEIVSGEVELKRLSGSGTTSIYYDFVETTSFSKGKTYAFLDAKYSAADAIAKLGSGAVLEVTSEENRSIYYIQRRYGETAKVTVYVNVINRGAGFDSCKIGGLYKVPGTKNPTEYRYFCGYGGAQNCGPLYAYTYAQEEVTYEAVGCTLKDIKNLGSLNSADYSLKIAYGSNSNQKYITLAPSNYTISPTEKDGQIKVTTTDDNGNTIEAVFETPVKLNYEGNDSNSDYKAEKVPAMQGAWKGNTITISPETPVRNTYSFENYLGSDGNIYMPGDSITLNSNIVLTAQWKDITAPVVTAGEISLFTRATVEEIKNRIREKIQITDNEAADQCSITFGAIDTHIAKKAGSKTIQIMVRDKAGNQTSIPLSVVIKARPLEIRDTAFTESTNTLSAMLYETGPETITETGFVWGIMTNPTITLHNGMVKTATAVTEPDDTISVAATDLQQGVTYYGRAYVISGGTTYYGEQISFGLGLPAYGSFTITGPGTVAGSSSGTEVYFTIARDGNAGEQTVYYRTLNGSAIGDTHFVHSAGSVTFADGETSKTIPVRVYTANTIYDGQTSTAYSNADRNFFMEIYNVVGGAALGSSKTASCILQANNNYKVPASVYDKKKVVETKYEEKTITDGDSFANVSTLTLANAGLTYLSSKYYQNYLNALGLKLGYSVSFQAAEVDDGYQSIQIVKGGSIVNNGVNVEENAITEFNPGGDTQYVAIFEHGSGKEDKAYYTYYFPDFKCSSANGILRDAKYATEQSADNGCILFDLSQKQITLGADASGKDEDDWNVKNATHTVWVRDAKEPQLIGAAPTAGNTTYRLGDTFTIALIFDEIVDSANTGSSSLKNMTVSTSWGTAAYSGGADTNVLYFTGTVQAGKTGELKLYKSNSDISKVRDMCATTGTTASAKTLSTGGTVNTAAPSLTLSSQGVSAGVGTAVITVNDNKDYTSGIKYVWTESETLPVTGWITLNTSELAQAKSATGFTSSIRQEPGSGNNGKWYLHVLANYDITQTTIHQSVAVDFGTKAKPTTTTPALTLTVTTDNSNWATSRTISVTATGGTELSYRFSGDTDWKTITINNNAATVTVLENGSYVFRLTSDNETLVKTLEVEKIDRTQPEAYIGKLDEMKSSPTTKEEVYTAVTLPIAVADKESGVNKLEYIWSTSATVSGNWTETAADTAELSYIATESSETLIFLHLRVTDGAGNTQIATAEAAEVISQNTVANYTPTITLEGGISAWTNDMPSLNWKLDNASGKSFYVILPDGTNTTEAEGTYLANNNGTYTFTVVEEEYGGSNSASLTISHLDITAPEVTVSGVPSGVVSQAQNIELRFSDSQSGVKGGKYAIVTDNTQVPVTGLQSFNGNSVSIPVDGEGTFYVYYEVHDNAGGIVQIDASTTAERPANITAGFTNGIKIHRHSYSYRAQENVITESCSCGHSETAVINKPSGTLTYTGNKEFQASVIYSANWAGDKLAIVYTKAGTVVTELKNAGTYTASITMEGATAQISYEVAKAVVTEPTIESKAFTGEVLTGDIPENSLYTVEENAGGINVGQYDVVLKLTDSTNYKWSTRDEEEITVKFQITKIKNVFIEEPAILNWTYGETPQEPTGIAQFGEIKYSYYDKDKKLLSEKPVKAGSYFLKAIVEEGLDYAELSSDYIAFEIRRQTVYLEAVADLFTLVKAEYAYRGEAIEPTVSYSGTDLIASDYVVTYENNINAGTGIVRITGQGIAVGTVEIPFTIKKAIPENITFPSNLSGNIVGVDDGNQGKLSDIALPTGFTWENPALPIVYGENTYVMIYTPGDTANYEVIKQNVKVIGLDVNKEPVVKSELVVEGKDTPKITVDGLEEEAKFQAQGTRDTEITITMMVAERSEAEIQASEDLKEAQKAIEEMIEKQENTNTSEAPKKMDFFEINLNKSEIALGQGETNSPITETQKVLELQVPYDFTGKENITVYRHHNNQAESFTEISQMPAVDSYTDGTYYLNKEAECVHIFTQKFSLYAIGYTEVVSNQGGSTTENSGGTADVPVPPAPTATNQKDAEPKTGDFTPVEIYATVTMVAGYGYLLLYFKAEDTGMTESRKKELVDNIIQWAKQGGILRRFLGIVAIFFLLAYYHYIGKQMVAKKSVCQN